MIRCSFGFILPEQHLQHSTFITKQQQPQTFQPQQQNQHTQTLNMVHLEEHEKSQIRFLGRGDRALIRPGVVLVAPLHEYSHWL